MIPTREGGRVPLSELAEIKLVNGASIIARRENQRRQITVRTNIRGRNQGSFVTEAQENLQRAENRLTVILPITIAIIFVLLFFMFGTAKYAGLVMLNVPFSLVGGILFLYLRHINLSVSAAVGFISLLGVAVMSGVLVIAEINHFRRSDPDLPVREAIIRGSLGHLRPVLLMVVVALRRMVPAARASGIGSDVQRPLATDVVGGLPVRQSWNSTSSRPTGCSPCNQSKSHDPQNAPYDLRSHCGGSGACASARPPRNGRCSGRNALPRWIPQQRTCRREIPD